MAIADPDFVEVDSDAEAEFFESLLALAARWRLIVGCTVVAALAGAGASFLLKPLYTAQTSMLPPQQSQSAAVSALSALGPLSGLIGGGSPLKSPADQLVSLAQSNTISDRIIDKFDLMKVYEEKYRADARRRLTAATRIVVGKKDGLVFLEVDDESPQRAAEMANRYVEELRILTSRLALTEAQQRRVFFEDHLKQTRDQLSKAQVALQASGYNPEALKAEPRSAAEGYAKLSAEVTAAKVRLQALRSGLTAETPEVQQQSAVLSALQVQLNKMESSAAASSPGDYIGKFREFKYQETLYDLFSRQYELARVDESRDGGTIQVLDSATPPERRSWPKRTLLVAGSAAAGFLLSVLWALTAGYLQQKASDGRRRSEHLRQVMRR